MNSHTHQLHCLLHGHQDIVLCGQYMHPMLMTAGKDKVIKLWKINQAGIPVLVANYYGHSDDVCGVDWLLKEKLIVSVGEDKMVKVWPMV